MSWSDLEIDIPMKYIYPELFPETTTQIALKRKELR